MMDLNDWFSQGKLKGTAFLWGEHIVNWNPKCWRKCFYIGAENWIELVEILLYLWMGIFI